MSEPTQSNVAVRSAGARARAREGAPPSRRPWGRPLTEEERPSAAAMGALLKALRIRADRTQADVAVAAGIGASTLREIERGQARTRESTLHRVVVVLVGEDQADAALAELIAVGGATLAHESGRSARQSRRSVAARMRNPEGMAREVERLARQVARQGDPELAACLEADARRIRDSGRGARQRTIDGRQ